MRNVLINANKYEHDERGFPLRFHPVDVQEREKLVRRAGERLAREWAERERMIHEYMPVAQALREKYRHSGTSKMSGSDGCLPGHAFRAYFCFVTRFVCAIA